MPTLAAAPLRAAALAALLAAALLAGERWQLQYFYDKNDSTLSFQDLQFPSARRGFALGVISDNRDRKPVLAITADGGRTWDLWPLKEPGLSLYFLHEQAGWMVSLKGRLWKTADGGRSWTQASLDNVRAAPTRVFFLDESRGWLLCRQEQVYGTQDGGRSWKLLAAARIDNTDDERSIYTWAAFSGDLGLVTGWHRLQQAGLRRLPGWMEPESIPIGNRPSTSLLLHTLDGGRNWKSHLLPKLGEITRVRISSAGAALMLLRHPDSLLLASEVVAFDLKTLRGGPVYGHRDRWLTDLAFAGPGRVFVVALDQEGRSLVPVIPAKLRVLQSTDAKKWTEMEVDYRAEALSAFLAVPEPAHAWLATDTGMILKLVQD